MNNYHILQTVDVENLIETTIYDGMEFETIQLWGQNNKTDWLTERMINWWTFEIHFVYCKKCISLDDG